MITFNTSSFSSSISDSDYGIPAPAIRGILIPYLVIAVVLGLLGNGIVIRSTFSVNVWKFDETLITLLRYLAMTDAGLTIFHVLPQSVSLIADSWVLREAGIIIAFVRYPLFMMEMSLVLRSWLCLWRSSLWSCAHATTTPTCSWLQRSFPLLFSSSFWSSTTPRSSDASLTTTARATLTTNQTCWDVPSKKTTDLVAYSR